MRPYVTNYKDSTHGHFRTETYLKKYDGVFIILIISLKLFSLICTSANVWGTNLKLSFPLFQS